MTVEELQIRVTAQTQGIEAGVSQVSRGLNSMGNTANTISGKVKSAFNKMDMAIKSTVVGAIADLLLKMTNGLKQFVGECTELGSDVTEVQNVVDTTFGTMSDKVDEFASNSIRQLGMSETACKKYTSTLGAILKSTGFETKDALTMSETLTQLTADMASFYNLDNESMFEKIRSGITGETEPLKQLGINMSVANLQAYALSQGIKKSYDKMSQSEQTLLRYNYLLSVTKDAQGDLARTSDSWANQTRLLNEQWNQLKTNLGKGFINMFTPIIRGLNVILEKLQFIGEWFAKITGWTFGDATADSGGSVVDTSLYDNAADAANGLADAIGDAGDESKKAGKKAKDAQKGLLSFDEINQLKDNSSGGSGGSGSSGDKADDVGNALGKLGNNTDKLGSKVGSLKKDTDSWLDKLLDQLKKIADALADIISKLLSIKPNMGLNWDSDKNKDTTKNKTTNDITNIKVNLDKDSMKKALDKVKELKKEIDNLLKGKHIITIDVLSNGIVEKINALKLKIDSLHDKKIKITLDDVGASDGLNKINALLIGLEVQCAASQNGPLRSLWEFLKNSFKIDTVTAFELIANSAKTSFSNTASFLNTCKLTAENVGGFFKNVLTLNFSGAFENIKNTASAWKNHITTCFENTKTMCSNHTDTLKTFVSAKWENLKQLVSGSSKGMKDNVSKDADSTKNKVESLGNYMTGTFAPKTSSALQTVISKFDSLWNSIKSGCTSALNGMIDKINGLTGGLNKLNVKMPQALGGGSIGFNIPKIPKLARGGIVDRATNFGNYIAGEAGKEMIVPLENTSFVDKLASSLGNAVMYSMSTAMSFNSNSDNQQNTTMELDGIVFARLITPYVVKEIRRVGVEFA